jgi:hypothetical protein
LTSGSQTCWHHEIVVKPKSASFATYIGKCPVERVGRQKGLLNVHRAQCIVEDVAKGMNIWDCVADISHAHKKTDPISSFSDLSGIASIPADDE